MTRRERHLRIIKSFGDGPSFRYAFSRIVSPHNMKALTDDAIEEVARELIDGHRRQQRYNREAKARRMA